MFRRMEQWVPSMTHHLKMCLHSNYLRKRHISNITHHSCSSLMIKASIYEFIFGFIFNAQQNNINAGYQQMDEGRNDSL